MIGYLEGLVVAKLDSAVVVRTSGGVGYQVNLPLPLLVEAVGGEEPVKYYVVTIVREGEISLYGFPSPAAKKLFESLISVSGIGPKVALALFSAFSAEELRGAIIRQDTVLLATIPGIGKKTATRLCLDLSDRLQPATEPPEPSSRPRGELLSALTNLGFPEKDVLTVLRQFPAEDQPFSDQLKQALALLGKR